MNILSCMRAAVFLVFFFGSVHSQIAGNLKIAFIRVSFESGDFPGFTGNGNFLMSSSSICDNYVIDPPPHDKNYFQSHINAVNNYYRTISYNSFGIDLDRSSIFPSLNNSSYKLNQPMNYYNELGKQNDHEKRITSLLKDAVEKAYEVDQINFDNYDLIAVIHPGLGQDFKLPFLDPTPEDIPSTFIDSQMVIKHFDEPFKVGNSVINSGIILPESQNHPLMDESIFNNLTNPCDIQYSITGTWALMIGFAIGLPPLWNIETGESGIGIFGLMDQGSNNGRGMIPSIPNPWTRINAGWETPVTYLTPARITIDNLKKNSIAKIHLNNSEYFLIENRNNWFRHGVDIDSARLAVWENTKNYPDYINMLFDSTGIEKNEFGVVTNVNNYNMGMPASGILIWHIDETNILNNISGYKINENKLAKGINLEEADGAQDIGYISNLLTDPSSGYWGDMWFKANNQFFRSNTINNLEFSSYTNPNTHTNNGYLSSILINNFSNTDTSMSFDFNYSRNRKFLITNNKSILFQWDIDRDDNLDFIGSGDSLWWSKDLEKIVSFKSNLSKDVQVCIAKNTEQTSIAIIEKYKKSYFVSRYIFNLNKKNFIKTWEREIVSPSKITLLKADEMYIYFEQDLRYFKVSVDGMQIVSNLSEAIKFLYPDSSIVNFKTNIANPNKFLFEENNFKSFSLADIDLDNSVDIIAIDTSGNIHAFDKNFISKNGFPINASAVGSILISDISDDMHPELIYEQINKSITIADYNGIELESLSLPLNSHLKSVGIYEGKKAIILSNYIEIFKDWKSQARPNEWYYEYGSPDFSRKVKLDTLPSTYSSKLLDKSLSYAYPNPSYGDDIIIRLQVGLYENIEIDIYDFAGFKKTSLSPISKEILFESYSVIEIPWDIQSVESGIYFASIKISSSTKIEKKIIKMSIIK